MKHGFIKVAAATPNIRVADVAHNVEEICRLIDETTANGAKIIVFPELCMTGYTCGDLMLQSLLTKKAEEGLNQIAAYTKDKDALIFVGLPCRLDTQLYDGVAVLNRGETLWHVNRLSEGTPYGGGQLLLQCEEMPELIVAAEIGDELELPNAPSIGAAVSGATLIVNCAASEELVGSAEHRRQLIEAQSAKLHVGYVFANAGEGESTTDAVYGGHSIIAENGSILAESTRFINEVIYSEIDIERLVTERQKSKGFQETEDRAERVFVPFSLDFEETKLTRSFEPSPFVPAKQADRDRVCEEVLMIQAMGLKKRLAHTNCQSGVIGISGGLDSTLALLVTAKAFDLQGIERSRIQSVTMPCFGTTDRTYRNACLLTERLGATLREVNLQASVTQHFADINHPIGQHDVTFENAQARERTQVLMDIANQTGGMVIGTGDLSELALGWATYNGDHMSMYSVNGSVPKTLVRHLVRYYADTCDDAKLQEVLLDVLDTPVSPELLPPQDGEIAQKTEDLVGPYELHDFYLYYMLRFGYEPSKIYRLAKEAFAGMYDEDTILRWLKTFYRRFFSQQFKRSCLPDGPKVGSVNVSPRGGLSMPSDACASLWLSDLEHM